MKIKISEIFYSAQGEGRFIGVPSVFLRTFGCNFTCAGFGMPKNQRSTEADEVANKVQIYKDFNSLPLVNTGCDSYASWHPAFKNLSPTLNIDEIVNRLLSITPNKRWQQKNGNDVHLVVTGGEPLLGWQRAYQELLEHERMDDLLNLTFETNGTQQIQSDLADYLDYWVSQRPRRAITFSVSPKLSASGESWDDAINPDIVSYYEELGTAYLKFVVETEEHFDEVDRAVTEFRKGGFAGVIYVMPQGGVVTPYERNRVRVADWALSKGYNYSPRLHVDLWGNGWGK